MPKIPDIIGLPPASNISNEKIHQSMPVANILPSIPTPSLGLSLFQLKPALTDYRNILTAHGFDFQGDRLRLAFLADNFPTDSFTNEYGESFIQKFSDVASSGMSDIAQFFGAKDVGQVIDESAAMMKASKSNTMGMAGDFIAGAKKAGGDMVKNWENMEGAGGSVGRAMAGMGRLASKVMAGQRVDFPQVWRGSGFAPSYTMTVRLYNPNPQSEEATNEFIVGPLCAILALALPQTDDGQTYSWPFFHQIEAKGLYHLQTAMVTSISVIKGGDQQSIAYNQRMGIVDVRIDFGSLYNSLVVEQNIGTVNNRPTLRKYLEAIKNESSDKFIDPDGERAALITSNGVTISHNKLKEKTPTKKDPSQAIGKNQAAQQESTEKNRTQNQKEVNTEKTLTEGSSIHLTQDNSDRVS